MADATKKDQEALPRIKENIERFEGFFRPNYDRYNEFQKLVFKTALNEDDISTLKALQKPIIEFNITAAPISRLCGEYSKQEPSIIVMPEFGDPVDEQTIKVVEDHLRHIEAECRKKNLQYRIYKDQLSGGFSAVKVYTEYAHEMSMDQVIKVKRVFEPTMCGFDPMARLPNKSDGMYCYEKYPMTKAEFKRRYPKVDLDDLSFNRDPSGFSWSYRTEKDEILILADYYEKKKKKKKIVRLANNMVMTMEKYQELLQKWEAMGINAVPPAIVGEPRTTTITTIMRYILIGNKIIECEETDYKYLPIVFFDGDSTWLQDTLNSNFEQFTKPYVYHAKGIQRLTNFSGQVIANDFEDMVMHKFKVAKESLPQEEEYLEAYRNVQRAAVLVYNAYDEQDPNKQLPAPQEIARIPLPPEVQNTFNSSMQMLQNILGSYDASLGINDNQLSGVAIVEAATQSNAAAMPYLVNNMQGWNQVMQIIIDLIPKYYLTPRTIPVLNREGKRDFIKINQGGTQTFNYDENALQVRVEMGPSFAIQKSKALQQITVLMQASPVFAEFMNSEGLPFILENMEFKGAEILAEKAIKWMDNRNKKMAQQAEQPQPEQILAQVAQAQLQLEAQKAQNDHEEAKAEMLIKTEQVINEKQKIDNERLAILQKSGESNLKLLASLAKAEAEETRARADLGLKHKDVHLKHEHTAAKLLHEMTKSKPEKEESEDEAGEV